MAIDVIDSARKSIPKSNSKILLLVEEEEQKTSLRHPIRKRILAILSSGVLDYETEVTKKVETLNDGTGLTHSVEVRRPFKRYWMDVPEIIGQFEKRYSDYEITSYQCYYHLQKLEEQGLVKQNPLPEYDTNGKKKRVRGLQFRSVARFFLQDRPRLTDESRITCIKFVQDLWDIEISDEDSERLIQLISEQDKTLFDAFEHLASHIEGLVDNMSFPLLLDRLAHVYLSDDENFIERYRDAKRILVRSGGNYLDSEASVLTSTKKEDVDEQGIGGNVNE